MAGRVDIIDHTADVGIEVHDDTLESLFARAAAAMFDIIADVSTVKPAVEEMFDLEEPGADLLLRSFLAELLYRFCANQMIYARFKVEIPAEGKLRATVAGETYDGSRHGIRTELKAVTYHQLECRKEDGGWFARVIFDI